MLQFNALLVACSPWSGLLQENAKRALSFCAALLCAWHVLLARCARSDANAWRIASVGLLAARASYQRIATLRRSSAYRLPYLSESSLTSVASRLHGLVCSGIITLAGEYL